MLRNRPAEYESVYAETTEFRAAPIGFTRQYLVARGAIFTVLAEMASAGIDVESVDHDEPYSKYEATSPDWFQIEH